MTDEEIISLYFDRNEEAIQETQRKYDSYCRSVITRILGNPRDAEETLSDVWLKAWLSIPPAHPMVQQNKAVAELHKLSFH